MPTVWYILNSFIENLDFEDFDFVKTKTKGNSFVIVNKYTYIKRMEILLSDQRKLEKVTLKNDAFLNFVVNQEKRIESC